MGLVIALNGYSGSGKDTLAREIIKLNPTFKRIAFGDELRNMVRDIGGYHIPPNKRAEYLDYHGNTWASFDLLCVQLAEKYKRAYGQDIFFRSAIDRVRVDDPELVGNYVVTDMRSPVEYVGLSKHFLTVAYVKIIRPGIKPLSMMDTMLKHHNFDITIINDDTVDQLRRKFITQLLDLPIEVKNETA